ncbi:MAG: hypothetical protein ACPG05_03430 [Bdellovibrionales bacterium]
MLGPISAYQVQQQNVQNSQVKNPNSQPFLAQEKNNQRAERLDETKAFGEALSDANKSNTQEDIAQRAQSLIAQGKTERGAMLDIVA